MDRLYCTLAEALSDLDINGVRDEGKLLDFIRSASEVIERRGGRFIPVTAQRQFSGNGETDIWIDPLLAITAITLAEGLTVRTLTGSDYVLNPPNRWWDNGPYTRLQADAVNSTQIAQWMKGQSNLTITGRWGLYEETKSTGATATQADGAGTSLVVDNAAAVSPGMTALIESEQELVEATGAATDSTANTAEAVDNSEEEIDLDNGALVNVGEIIRVDVEKMRVLDKATNTIVVSRGYGGSKVTTHLTGADVYVYRTFTVKRGLNGTAAAAHASKAVSRYVAPSPINYLCRQIAGLMLKKSQSAWAGKVGSAETGEVFYFNEFPNDPLAKIMEGFRYVN